VTLPRRLGCLRFFNDRKDFRVPFHESATVFSPACARADKSSRRRIRQRSYCHGKRQNAMCISALGIQIPFKANAQILAICSNRSCSFSLTRAPIRLFLSLTIQQNAPTVPPTLFLTSTSTDKCPCVEARISREPFPQCIVAFRNFNILSVPIVSGT